MHNDIYQVMFVPSSAGNGGRGRVTGGSAVAGSAVPRRLTASRVPEGVRRHCVARIDDAQSSCVSDVCAIISEERGGGERGSGGHGGGRCGGGEDGSFKSVSGSAMEWSCEKQQ